MTEMTDTLKMARDALTLAANRLELLALEFEYGTTKRNIADEWAQETRAAIASIDAQQAATVGTPSVSQQYIRQQVAADMAPLYAAFAATPPAVQAQSVEQPNIVCKSVQKRLATQRGYVQTLTDEQIARIKARPECWEHVGQRIEFRPLPFARAVLAAAPPAVQAPKPLTEADILDCVRSVGVPAPMGMTRDRGPYEVTEPTWFLVQLVRAIEKKIGAAAQGGEHVK